MQLPSRTSIRGQVRDASTHTVLPHVIVNVDEQDSGSAAQLETDSSGKFDVQGLAPGIYTVSIRWRGYRDVSQRVDLTISATSFLDFELLPLPGSEPAQPAAGNTIDARQASIPPKARKEFEKGRQSLLAGKDLHDSVEHLQKAIGIAPQFTDAYVLLGMAYLQSNDPTNAKSSLQKALELDPKLAAAHFTLGMVLNAQKDYAGAEKTLTEGLELSPDSADGHYELARTYWALGKWQDAEPQALKAVSLKPDLPPPHVLLGNIALRKSDPAAALKEFQEYLRLDPNGPFATGVKTMVDKLERDSAKAQ